jgi:hypothetical protein
MYPGLRELQKTHGEHLSILSVMTDEKHSDTEEAASSGKITWNLHWDGHRGPLATKWAVTGFPTVYVIDPDGRIAGNSLRGDELRDKVAELLQ